MDSSEIAEAAAAGTQQGPGSSASWRPLQERLKEQSRLCLLRTQKDWLHFLPLSLLSAAIGYFALYMIPDMLPSRTRDILPDFVLPLYYGLSGVLCLLGSPLGAYHLYNYVVGSRFWNSYRQTRLLMEESSLPLLVADGSYCTTVIEGMRGQSRTFLFAPPANQRLDEQLLLAACYRLALRRGDFRLSEHSPALRSGDWAYFGHTPLARKADVASGVCLLVPYCNCLGLLALPLLIVSLLRMAELRGALAAICDFFSDEPLPEAARRGQAPAPSA